MSKILKINFDIIKIFLSNQSEVILFSANNYLVTIYAARYLSINQFGIFAILYSFYLLIQALYTSSLGETFLIKKDIKNKSEKQPLNQIINLILLILICLSIISIILFIRFKATLIELLIYGFSITNLILFINTRFFNLANGWNGKSLKNVIIFSIITFFIFILKVMFNISFTSEYQYFLLLGLPAFFVNLITKKHIRFVLDKKDNFFKENYFFIFKSFALAIIIWCYGHLHWLLIGSLVSINLVGIVKACFSIVNPVFSISRAMTIFYLNISSKKNDLYTLNKVLFLTFSLSHVGLFLWLIFPNEILNLTIGIKYYEYKNIISVLFLIPPFANSTSIANSFLKFNNKFRVISITYIISVFFINIFIYFNRFIEIQPIHISIILLLTYMFNFLFIYLGIRRPKFFFRSLY